MIIGHEIRRYRDEIVHHIRQLVRIRSVMGEAREGMPFGEGVDRALAYMLDLSKSMGFATRNVDGYAGHAEYGEGDGLVAVLVHLDTVEEGEGWTFPPFGGELHEGKIIGRGASDNKGPAVVALYALKTLKELGIVPRKKIRVIFGTNEESGMKDMDYYFSKEPLPEMAFCPDAGYPIFNVEMGNMNVVFSRKHDHHRIPRIWIQAMQGGNSRTLVPGSCRAQVSLERLTENEIRHFLASIQGQDVYSAVPIGKRIYEIAASGAHGSDHPKLSPNAVANMIALLTEWEEPGQRDPLLHFLREKIGRETGGESLGIRRSDDVSGSTAVFLKQITLDGEGASAVCNIRYPVTCNGNELLAIVEEQARAYGVEVQVARHLHPVYVPPDHPVIVRLSRAYEDMTGQKAELLRMGAGTYCRKLKNNGVAFGAGLPGGVNTNVHQADEFVRVEDMMKHAEICLQGMYELIQ